MTQGWRRVALLLLVATAARAATFGNPAVHADEQFYFAVARAMANGALPYVDVWDRKPLGLFLLYLPAAALPLPWGTFAYQALALACVVATAGLVARLAALAGWGKGALAAAIAYVLWLDLLNGASGQSPVFYNLPMAAAAWLIARRPGDRRAGVVAMALVGCALQVKYAALVEGLFFGLWLLHAERQAGRRWLGHGVALVAVAVLPTALAFGAYAALGQADAWVFANVTSILLRRPDPVTDQLRNAGVLALLLAPLLSMAAAGWGRAQGGEPDARRFLRGWLAAAIGGVVLFGGWYDHYGLPVALPASACAAGFLGGHGRRWTPALLLLAAAAGQAKVLTKRAQHGDGAQLAALARAVGRGPGCLFVYSGETLLYAETERCALTRYIFPTHLNLAREQGAIGVDQAAEVRRVLRARPAVIVMGPPYAGERPEIRRIVASAVARDYRLTARLPMGWERVSVYHLRAGEPAAQPLLSRP